VIRISLGRSYRSHLGFVASISRFVG
jgi:hypothetical protein